MLPPYLGLAHLSCGHGCGPGDITSCGVQHIGAAFAVPTPPNRQKFLFLVFFVPLLTAAFAQTEIVLRRIKLLL